MEKILSLDVETNGLWGQPFAIGAVVYDHDAKEIDRITLRIGDDNVTDPWVREHVMPALSTLPITDSSYEDMLKTFSEWYKGWKDGVVVLWHMGHVVEAFLFREMVRLGYIGVWDAPYTPIDLADVLRLKGEDPASVDTYISKRGLALPKDIGSTHNPLYDVVATATAYFDLLDHPKK